MPITRLSRHAYPWRPGNEFSLFIDGEAFFSIMLDAIRSARYYVMLELYLVESGQLTTRFIDALTEASFRGVRVWLLFDGFGSQGLSLQDQVRLRTAGAELVLFHPLKWSHRWTLLRRDHRKLMVVDGREAFVGGVGLTDDFDPGQVSPHHWRETVVRIRGPLLQDWQAIFTQTWQHVTGNTTVQEPVITEHAGVQRGRAVISPWRGRRQIQRSVLRHIRNAQSRVWVATAYYVPGIALQRALAHAARRGVDVRLLCPGARTDHPAVRRIGHWYYSRLLRDGVRIFEYQPRFLHTKIMLCDDWVSIGSANFDRWNWRWNLENNQEIDDATFANQTAAMYQHDLTEAKEILYEVWRTRSRYKRLQAWFWSNVAAWIENRIRRWRR